MSPVSNKKKTTPSKDGERKKNMKKDGDKGMTTTGMPSSTTSAPSLVESIGDKTSKIRNKMVRSQQYHKLKHEKNKEKRMLKRKREKESKRAEELGLPIPEKEKPKTIESMREVDETMIGKTQEDEEVKAEEKDDEFAEHFDKTRTPNVLVTTSYKCSKIMYKFIADMLEVFPSATYYKRKGYPLKKIVEYASHRDFTDVVVFHEDRKQVNGMIVVHLPNGPTALFRLSSLTLSTDIKGHGRATTHKPELILNNFDTMLGHRIGRMFASLFCQDPNFKGRRAVTLHNQRDFIFFRHHRYIFEEKEKKQVEKTKDGKMKKVAVPVVKARLQELGPRFTLKLESLQKGTFDTKGGEFEWVHKSEMDTSRRKFHL